jgi:pSer/pThr/pTyr-binding forkhead associated (FHA) protein
MMKNRFAQLEARLQALIENGAVRLFLFGENQSDLGARLVAEMKANIRANTDGSFWAPNQYFLVLSPDQAQALQNNPACLDELGSLLQKVGDQAELRFASSPVVKILMEPALKADEIQILAKYNLEDLGDTSAMETEPLLENNKDAPEAYLIVNGNQVFPLNKSLLNIGRSSSNDLILDDLKVSRSHAQLRLIDGHYVIFDLDSTGGTFVNDQRVIQHTLYPGDVISLAGVPLIFGQEPTLPGGTQEYIPPVEGLESSQNNSSEPGKAL